MFDGLRLFPEALVRLLQKHNGDNGRGKQNIWQLTRNPAGSKQDLPKQNEQSEKSGKRWEDGGG